LATGVDGFRYDAAAFMPKGALQQFIRFADDIAERPLFHWCDGVELFNQIEGMSAYFDHDGVKRLKSGEELRYVLSHPSVERIVYLTNHDTLHQNGSAQNQWGAHYRDMRAALLHQKVNLMQSFAEWRDPSACYSFLD
jgi:glycosidase